MSSVYMTDCEADILKASLMLPKRDPEGHKGAFGKVLIIAGSEGMTGAAILACKACLRSGAGLAYLAAPRGILPVYESAVTEAVKLPLGEANDVYFKPSMLEDLLLVADKADTVLIGPGIGRRNETFKFLCSFLKKTSCKRIVIDADALNLLSEKGGEWLKNTCSEPNKKIVLTPHKGEMNALLGLNEASQDNNTEDERIRTAKRCSEEYGAVVIYKGHRTVIADGESGRHTINCTGNTGLSKGGSGDVLAGLLAGFLPNINDLFDAAALAVFIHGMAGEVASNRFTEYCCTAENVVESLSDVFKRLV